jgi:uncharacterized protein (DUF697 family)
MGLFDDIAKGIVAGAKEGWADAQKATGIQKPSVSSSPTVTGSPSDNRLEGTKNSLLDRVKREISEIEFREDLTTDEKVRQVTHITCATCAGVAIQPIPFADIFILTPIQIYMGTRIAAIRGVPVSEAEADDILKEIIGALGMGFVAQQTALGIWKFIIPGAGGFMTIPIVYGLSYAIMNVMDAYFVAKASNRRLSATEIKALWGKARAEGESQGKAQEQSVKK